MLLNFSHPLASFSIIPNLHGAALWSQCELLFLHYIQSWDTIKPFLKIFFTCPFVVIDPTHLRATMELLLQGSCMSYPRSGNFYIHSLLLDAFLTLAFQVSTTKTQKQFSQFEEGQKGISKGLFCVEAEYMKKLKTGKNHKWQSMQTLIPSKMYSSRLSSKRQPQSRDLLWWWMAILLKILRLLMGRCLTWHILPESS